MSKFNDLMLNWVTSTSTKKDEREKSELNQKLANMFGIYYIITAIIIAVFTGIDMYHHTISIQTIILFATFFIFNLIIVFNFSKNRYFEEAAYSPKEYKKLVKRYTILSIIFMVYFGCCMAFFSVMLDYFWNDPIRWTNNILHGLISGFFFGAFMFCVYIIKLKKEY
ncbi:hypothetical protein ACN9U3_08635 [Staphylococcus caprae]|uniref:hypothetical protein n=1 Tax=Staphylococcus caprae TaxID=29380 RepID=UPI001C114127|nr:hypothetical protein [Staphylococcus caprae]MBU5272016.1 hypothetical protein [Staphylococcus caprae]MCI2955042.1 hypothetical protein [Staphylococcus caprae]